MSNSIAHLPRSLAEILGATSRQKEERRRQEDLDFIQKVKEASLERLEIMRISHEHKNAPDWKKIAIARAIVRKKDNP